MFIGNNYINNSTNALMHYMGGFGKELDKNSIDLSDKNDNCEEENTSKPKKKEKKSKI